MRKFLIAALAAATSLWADPAMDAIRQKIVDTAMTYKGTPYVYGADAPPAFDCSGFVQYVYKKGADLMIPRTSRDQWTGGFPIKPEEMRPGDVFVFDTVGGRPSHVALFIGDGSMIQAVSDGSPTGVIISSIKDRYWAPRIIGQRSFLDRPPEGAAAAAPKAPSSQQPTKQAAPVSPVATSPAAPATAAPVAATPPAPIATAPQAPVAAAPAPVQKGPVQAAPVHAAPVAAAPTAVQAAPIQTAPAQTAAAAPQPGEPPIVDLGFTLTSTPTVYTDKIPTAVNTKLAFTITNDTGRDGNFQVDFYKAEVDFKKNAVLRHEAASIPQGGRFTLDPYLFSEPGTYRLNVKTSGNEQLMQRSFQVVRIGPGGAIQLLPEGDQAPSAKPAAPIPAGTPLTKVGLIIGATPSLKADAIKATVGSALVVRIANGTTRDGGFDMILYKSDRNPRNNLVLQELRSLIPSGGWEQLEPFLFKEPGTYRILVKTTANESAIQRDIIVTTK